MKRADRQLLGGLLFLLLLGSLLFLAGEFWR